jgi:hypothetical protein
MILGRPHKIGCSPPVTHPCDVSFVASGWMPWAMLAGLALGVVLLVVAGLMAADREA